MRGRSVQQRDDKAGVIARAHDFRLEHNTPWLCPGLCCIGEVVIEAATGRRRLAVGVGQGDALVMQTTRLLEGGSGLPEQDGIASEAKDKIGPASVRDHLDHLGRCKMTIPTAKNVCGGPVVAQIRQQPDQDHRIVCPGGTGTRTQVGRDEGMRRPFKNEERQIAMVLIVMIIERKLLLAIRRIVRVVYIQDNGGGGLGVAGDEVVHQGKVFQSCGSDILSVRMRHTHDGGTR